MSSKEIKYESLHQSPSEPDSVQYHAASSGTSRWKNPLSIIFIIFLVITNGVWIDLYNQQRQSRGKLSYSRSFNFQKRSMIDYLCLKSTLVDNRYPGHNGPTVSVPYFRSTHYSDDENLEVTSDLWENLYPRKLQYFSAPVKKSTGCSSHSQ